MHPLGCARDARSSGLPARLSGTPAIKPVLVLPGLGTRQTGGGAMWVTGSYDIDSNQVLWGTGNPVPMFNPYGRPGDNLYTNSLISWDPDSGKMNWYHQYTPGDMWDYDEAGTHILIDGQVDGQARKLVTHSGRNGFFYALERANGQTLRQSPMSTRSPGPRASIKRPGCRSNTILRRTFRSIQASRR
jgi:glucose dehydrogenase